MRSRTIARCRRPAAWVLGAALVAALSLADGPAQAGYDEAAAYSAEHDGVSLLILKDGQVVHESYANGGAADKAYELASGTKSFVGVIAAAAVQDGLLSLDERVADTLTEWRGEPTKGTMTVRELLHLVGGIEARSGRGRHRVVDYAATLEVPVTGKPGETFDYGPNSFQVFGLLMSRKLKAAGSSEDPLAYLERRIFTPIGLRYGSWKRTDAGDPHLPSGAALTAREWAKFGAFILNGGVHEGKRLVDKEAFEAIFHGTPANPAYGLTWWLNRPVPEHLKQEIPQLRRATDLVGNTTVVPKDLVFAAGAGKQRLYISFEENLVIVRQGELNRRTLLRNRFSDVAFWEALRK